MLRIVVDTNVIVSGILSLRGSPAEVLDLWRKRRFLLLTSPAMLAEVEAVLRYPHIREKYLLDDGEIDQFVQLLEHDGLVVPGTAPVSGSLPSDPKDEMILACALDGEADFIVSGDHHLIELGTFREIPILNARKLLDLLK